MNKIEQLLNRCGYSVDYILQNGELFGYLEIMQKSGKFTDEDIILYIDNCRDAIIAAFRNYSTETALEILFDENFDISDSDSLGYVQIKISDDKYMNIWSIEYENGRLNE